MFQIVFFLISFNLSTSKKSQSKQKLKKKWYSLHDFMLLQIKSMAPGAKRWPGFFWRPWAPQVEDCRNLYKGTKWLYYCRGWTNQIRGYRVQIFAIEMTSKLPGLSKNACHPSVNICKHSQWEAYLGEAARLKTQAFFIIIFFWNFAYKPIPKTNSDPAYLTEEANFHISTQRRRKLLAGEVGGRNRSFEVSSIKHLANTVRFESKGMEKDLEATSNKGHIMASILAGQITNDLVRHFAMLPSCLPTLKLGETSPKKIDRTTWLYDIGVSSIRDPHSMPPPCRSFSAWQIALKNRTVSAAKTHVRVARTGSKAG